MKLIKRKKIRMIISVSVVVVGIILYLLADRYLIEHVETLNISAKTTTSNQTLTNQTASTMKAATTSAAMIDDQRYLSDNIQIQIEKVETGSGNNKVTYYVADVQVTDISFLQSAFAKGTFGRNITEKTSTIAENNQAIFAINGDYFGFRDDGIEIRNGVAYRDNGTRTGAAINADGTMSFYDEEESSASELLEQGVLHTFSFGPILVDNGEVADLSGKITVDENFGNNSIEDPNPRTGIGMIDANHYMFVVVDGREPGYSKGVTLEEFADIFAGLGCENAYNLDGGNSTTMYFNGEVINQPSGKSERSVSDILYLTE